MDIPGLGVNSRRYLYIFLAFIFSLSAFAVFGDKGLLDAYRLSGEKESILTTNLEIEAKNKRLEEEINLLKTDKRYIAMIARKELGMIGRDEVIYMFK